MTESRANDAAQAVRARYASGDDLDKVFDTVVAEMGLSTTEEAEAVQIVRGMVASREIDTRPPSREPEAAPATGPLDQARETRYGHNECHYLTAAMAKFRPAGRPWGLYNGDNLIHSVFQLPGEDVFLDAFGVMVGRDQLEARRHHFLFAEESVWRPMEDEELWRVTSLARSRRMRLAATAARKVLAAAR